MSSSGETVTRLTPTSFQLINSMIIVNIKCILRKQYQVFQTYFIINSIPDRFETQDLLILNLLTFLHQKLL